MGPDPDGLSPDVLPCTDAEMSCLKVRGPGEAAKASCLCKLTGPTHVLVLQAQQSLFRKTLQDRFEAYIASNALWQRALPRVASCQGTSLPQSPFLLPL
jgi:hypothetical protein